MAKANAASGSSVYVPEGAEVPTDLGDEVRLVGPGAPDVAEEGDPDVLWICVECSTAYSVGADRCPQCGATGHVEQGSPEHQALLDTAGEQDGGEQDGEQDGADEDEPDYDALTVEQLRDELGERDLPKGGNKAELVLRLRADDKEHARPADTQGVDGTVHS